MSLPGLALVLFVAATVLLAVGLWLRQREQREQDVSPEAFQRCMKEAVVLAIEMCRADGQVQVIEIEAIRAFLRRTVPDVDAPTAERWINEAMRGTIARGAIRDRAVWLRRELPAPRRDVVLDLIEAVAQADGRIEDGEQRFLRRVARWLGFDADEVAVRINAESQDSQ